MAKDKRRILAIKNHDIDLLAESAFAINDVSLGSLIALREVGL
jgi:hypothetical protein